MDSTVFGEGEGTLKSGWMITNDKDTHRKIASILRSQGVRLCNPVGQYDLTSDILEVLESPDFNYITDVLVKADEKGRYQAILLGGREQITYEPLGKHVTFHVVFLCSIVRGAGAELMEQVKSRLSPPLRSITLEPVEDIKEKGYYYKFGFKHIPNKSPTMIWYPGITGGRRRRRRTHRRRSQTHKLKFR